MSPTNKKNLLKSSGKQQTSFEQVVPLNALNNNSGSLVDPNDKAAKAYEFLKEESIQNSKLSAIQVDQQQQSNYISKKATTYTAATSKEDGRMQAYGWSLPSKSSLALSNTNDSSTLTKSSSAAAITVPVPVYCRPLFEHDNNLKMSCASTINYLFDVNCSKNCGQLIESSPFSYFKSNITSNDKKNVEYKSSCIWICNLNDNDTHISILDANKPGDLIEQFILKYLKIYCMQSVSGADKSEFPLSEEKLRNLSKNLYETNSQLDLVKKSEQEKSSGTQDKANDSVESITYIEFENEQDSTLNKSISSENKNGNQFFISIYYYYYYYYYYCYHFIL